MKYQNWGERRWIPIISISSDLLSACYFAIKIGVVRTKFSNFEGIKIKISNRIFLSRFLSKFLKKENMTKFSRLSCNWVFFWSICPSKYDRCVSNFAINWIFWSSDFFISVICPPMCVAAKRGRALIRK